MWKTVVPLQLESLCRAPAHFLMKANLPAHHGRRVRSFEKIVLLLEGVDVVEYRMLRPGQFSGPRFITGHGGERQAGTFGTS